MKYKKTIFALLLATTSLFGQQAVNSATTILQETLTNDAVRIYVGEKQTFFSRTLSAEELKSFLNKTLKIQANLDIQQLGSTSQVTIITEISVESASGSESINESCILEVGDDHHVGHVFTFNPLKIRTISPVKISISCLKITGSTTNRFKIRDQSNIKVDVQ